MTELELRQMFKNLSDCYADTGRFENDGSYTEGLVIQAMTEDRFIEALKEAKLLPIPAVVGSCHCSRCGDKHHDCLNGKMCYVCDNVTQGN